MTAELPLAKLAVAKSSESAAADRPSRAEAQEAVRTLIRWAGDDAEREGLLGTPDRVTRSYEEFYSGYQVDPVVLLERTFEEIEGYDEMVLLRAWLRSSAGPMLPTCPTSGWWASASWCGSSRPTPSACRSRRR
jgi:hypothetical protein